MNNNFFVVVRQFVIGVSTKRLLTSSTLSLSDRRLSVGETSTASIGQLGRYTRDCAAQIAENVRTDIPRQGLRNPGDFSGTRFFIIQ